MSFINNVMLMATDIGNKLKILLLEYNTRRIVVAGTVFNWSKKPSNTTNTLAVGEVITNGRISETIHIYSAIYTNALADADIDNFGTEANNFTDGNYIQVQFEPNL